MKFYIKVTLVMSVTAVFFVSVVVSAQSDNNSTDIAETTMQQQLDQRQDERKRKLKENLDAAKKTRIENRCKTAQGKLSSLSGRIQGTTTSRGEVYDNLIAHLNDLVVKLEAKSINTSDLQAEINTLADMIATFNSNFDDYRQVVDDLILIDCQADPVGFQAALVEARRILGQLRQDSASIKTQAKDVIKPILVAVRQQVGVTGDNN